MKPFRKGGPGGGIDASLSPEDHDELDVFVTDGQDSVLYESDDGIAARVAEEGLSTTAMTFDVAGRSLAMHFHPRVAPSLAPTLMVGVYGVVLALVAMLAVAVLEVARRLRQQVKSAEQLGPYRLVREIGHGGMGVVYQADHELLRRPTAVKVMQPSLARASLLARFEREVQLTSKLTHPNTVAVYDFGRTSSGAFYYAMEYLPGVNVEELVRATGPLPPARAVHLLRQVCASLTEAHAKGLVHRDIKPSNVMVCERGGLQDFVKVLDFGLVKQTDAVDQGLTEAGEFIGTPNYAAPELLSGKVLDSPRSDIYSVGAVAYFMLTGEPVFGGTSLPAVISRVLAEDPVPLTDRVAVPIPPGLEDLIHRCLAKNPADRPTSVRVLGERLAACELSWSQANAARCWQSFLECRVADPEGGHLDTAWANTLAVGSRERDRAST